MIKSCSVIQVPFEDYALLQLIRFNDTQGQCCFQKISPLVLKPKRCSPEYTHWTQILQGVFYNVFRHMKNSYKPKTLKTQLRNVDWLSPAYQWL
jgi:hypothetical protein